MTKKKAYEKLLRLQAQQKEVYNQTVEAYNDELGFYNNVKDSFKAASSVHYNYLLDLLRALELEVRLFDCPRMKMHTLLKLRKTDCSFMFFPDWDVFCGLSKYSVSHIDRDDFVDTASIYALKQVNRCLEECIDRYNACKDIPECHYDFQIIFKPLIDFIDAVRRIHQNLLEEAKHREILDAIYAPTISYGVIF